MAIFAYSLISVIVVSLISLIGVFVLVMKPENVKKISFLLVGFAAGSLLGDVLIHLLPEAFAQLAGQFTVPILTMAGMIVFFFVEKILHWRHCHVPDCSAHPQTLADISLVGDSIHNFIDGLMIAAAYLVSIPIGLATTIAVVCHEIPQEIGNFGVLLHGGYSAKKALFYNFLSGLTAVFGALVALFIGAKMGNFAQFLLPVTAGGLLYIAAVDLIPEMHHDSRPKASIIQFLCLASGFFAMALMAIIF